MKNIKEKVVIITGSRRGIGKGIAEKFAESGVNIIITDIDLTESQKTANEISNKYNVKTKAIKCDVSNKKQINNLIKKTIKYFGKIDILVNNAGIFFQKSFLDHTEKDWDKIININLKGVFLCSQAVAKEMTKQNYGKIINIASIAGIIGYPNASAYCASKAGIINLTKELSIELASNNINVNCVAPGVIETEMTKNMLSDKKTKKQILKQIPLKRTGQPKDIANAVYFLANNDSDYITGQTLVVDGGWIIQ